MGIKAIGVITENPQDGERVKVRWQPPMACTASGTTPTAPHHLARCAWRMECGCADRVRIQQQAPDIERFRNAPYWKDRFGTLFQWADFYEGYRRKLPNTQTTEHRSFQGIHQIAQRVQAGLSAGQTPDGSSGPLQDICPFTVMGTFNRGMTDANRKLVLQS